MIVWFLAACTTDGGALAGDWIAAFYRTGPDDQVVEGDGSLGGALPDTGSVIDAGPEPLPACDGDSGAENFRAWLHIRHTVPVAGEHLSLFPEDPRPEASNDSAPGSLMGGLVVGDWQGGRVRLDLIADLDSPLVTSTVRDAWRDHHLVLQGTAWGDRCWSASWAWVDALGVEDETERGVVFVRRR